MDTVKQAEVLHTTLDRIEGHLKRIPKPNVDTLLIEDRVQNAFLLMRVGWHERKRVNNTVIFARVKDGKIWIEDDNTELSFFDELVKAGVPKSDIVLAFQPPELRHLTDFAVA